MRNIVNPLIFNRRQQAQKVQLYGNDSVAYSTAYTMIVFELRRSNAVVKISGLTLG